MVYFLVARRLFWFSLCCFFFVVNYSLFQLLSSRFLLSDGCVFDCACLKTLTDHPMCLGGQQQQSWFYLERPVERMLHARPRTGHLTILLFMARESWYSQKGFRTFEIVLVWAFLVPFLGYNVVREPQPMFLSKFGPIGLDLGCLLP